MSRDADYPGTRAATPASSGARCAALPSLSPFYATRIVYATDDWDVRVVQYRPFLYYTDFDSGSEKVKTVRLNRTGVIRTIMAATLLSCMLLSNPDHRSAHAATLLLPPRSVFFLPSALTGPPFAVYGSQTSSTSHFPSGDILTTYWWSVLPVGMNKPSTGTFSVMVMHSAALAATKSANLDSLASHGCIGNDAGCSTTSPPNTPLLGKPAGGWLRGVCSQPTYCAFGGGAA